jgi:hypothetical protein
MAWSMLNLTQANPIKSLLDDVENGNKDRPGFEPAMPRAQAEGIIHAVIWLMACRGSDTAAAYAHDALRREIGKELIEWMHSMIEFDRKCL